MKFKIKRASDYFDEDKGSPCGMAFLSGDAGWCVEIKTLSDLEKLQRDCFAVEKGLFNKNRLIIDMGEKAPHGMPTIIIYDDYME